jgi:hypothetical protein
MVGDGAVKVLIVPEDPTYDQYVLKPVVERIFSDLERRARIWVLQNPRLTSIEQALDAATLAEIVENHPMVDLFLVLVDRDGDSEGRPVRARAREDAHPDQLFVCLAVEEVEVWMLAIHRDKLPLPWNGIRAEHHPKERFAEPFLSEHAPKLGPGGGRKWAMRGLGSKWRGILRGCPELAELRERIAGWLAARSADAVV